MRRDRVSLFGMAGRLKDTQMPVVQALLNGRWFSCLVDTGSECTIISARVVEGPLPQRGRPFITADGRTSYAGKSCGVFVGLQGHCFKVAGLVVAGLENLGADCLLGNDVVDHMGGVSVKRGPDSRYSVEWGKPSAVRCCWQPKQGKPAVERQGVRSWKSASAAPGASPRPLEVVDKDFVATFTKGRWLVKWRWSDREPDKLQNRVAEYKCTRTPGVAERYNAEIQDWISKGWLVKWDGPVKGVIPLLAVVQPTKDKVRPVMDYRELNEYVECHTGGDGVSVCAEKVREWRQWQGEIKVVDLKSAYLQIHVCESLWQYQVVRYGGQHYALTRLGFGLSCAPRIMTLVLRAVLSQDERIRSATDHYIDDIVVRESVVSAQELREHLRRFGFVTKEPEGLDGGRVLGIALAKGRDGHLRMSRGTPLSEISSDLSGLTKRGLFSLCGRLTGHYPVVGWLRPHCSYLKRLGCDGAWDEPVSDAVRALASDLLKRAQGADPVRGRWAVNPAGSVTVWTDASSLATGVVLEVDGEVVEDASWLRKKTDLLHINVAELEAVGRGINLAIAWGFKTMTVATDSRTVLSWMDSTVEERTRVRTKGAAEMLIKRRLEVIKKTITEYGLAVSVRFVSTTENRADELSRVAKKWLGHRECGDEVVPVSAALITGESLEDAIWAAHLPHHLGIDRTLYLGRQIRQDMSRDQVKRALQGCEACQRVDPALRVENLVGQGSLAVERNWCRVAADVTHFGTKVFLSLVDCGPSRFAIWRGLRDESAASIVAELHQVVRERGPFEELLLDNSAAFRSACLEQFADEWCIALRFRAAYAPSGNGIVERNHRTIKRIAARGKISPEEAVFWYNVTPRKEMDKESVPSSVLFKYEWRVPYDVNAREVKDGESSAFAVGDEVWVKPMVPSCTRQWTLGVITRVVSKHVVCVDGMPRHVRDVRKRRGAGQQHEVELLGGGGDPFNYPEEPVGGHDVTEVTESESGGLTESDYASIVVTDSDEVVEVPAEAGVERAGEPAELGVVPEEPDGPRRSNRARRPPTWMADYEAE